MICWRAGEKDINTCCLVSIPYNYFIIINCRQDDALHSQAEEVAIKSAGFSQKLNKKCPEAKSSTSLVEKYRKLNCWGMLVSVDVYGCEPDYIRQPKKIKEFMVELCKSIGMKRYGPAQIKRFGEGDLLGYSALQFIETSSITMHFDDVENRAFVEIFSCKFFEPKKAEQFCRQFLKAKSSKVRHFLRY